MSVERTRAIVLRRTNYGEADRILRLLTPLGQRSVMAKGVRREKSKLAGGIELFAISDVVISTGRGDLGILTSTQLVHFYRHILEDYDRLQFGYEAINLVSRASESIDEPEWYGVLSEVYMGLDAMSIPLQLTQSWFYLHYAELTGYELNLSVDVSGQPLSSDKTYMYDINERGLRRADQGEISADHIKLLRILMTKSIESAAQIGGIASVLPDVWLITRQHASV
ncbi:DNA repair protein RecO [Candidatus Saccharibacteria bacterium oral taxon 955]|nr:DNA repair protein RecO [Candidatus Saccharibacteria bacterium oral taxon 955]